MTTARDGALLGTTATDLLLTVSDNATLRMNVVENGVWAGHRRHLFFLRKSTYFRTWIWTVPSEESAYPDLETLSFWRYHKILKFFDYLLINSLNKITNWEEIFPRSCFWPFWLLVVILPRAVHRDLWSAPLRNVSRLALCTPSALKFSE